MSSERLPLKKHRKKYLPIHSTSQLHQCKCQPLVPLTLIDDVAAHVVVFRPAILLHAMSHGGDHFHFLPQFTKSDQLP